MRVPSPWSQKMARTVLSWIVFVAGSVRYATADSCQTDSINFRGTESDDTLTIPDLSSSDHLLLQIDTDGRVAIKMITDGVSDHHRIWLGTDSNRQSAVGFCDSKCTKQEDVNYSPLQEGVLRSLWISWADQRIKMGSGDIVDEDTFLVGEYYSAINIDSIQLTCNSFPCRIIVDPYCSDEVDSTTTTVTTAVNDPQADQTTEPTEPSTEQTIGYSTPTTKLSTEYTSATVGQTAGYSALTTERVAGYIPSTIGQTSEYSTSTTEQAAEYSPAATKQTTESTTVATTQVTETVAATNKETIATIIGTIEQTATNNVQTTASTADTIDQSTVSTTITSELGIQPATESGTATEATTVAPTNSIPHSTDTATEVATDVSTNSIPHNTDTATEATTVTSTNSIPHNTDTATEVATAASTNSIPHNTDTAAEVATAASSYSIPLNTDTATEATIIASTNSIPHNTDAAIEVPIGTTADRTHEYLNTVAATQAGKNAELSPTHRCCPCVQQKSGATSAAKVSRQTELQEATAAIRKELTVPTHNMSSTTRKKTCAQDDRPSSMAMGSLGAALFVMPVVLVVAGDVMKVVLCLLRAGTAGK